MQLSLGAETQLSSVTNATFFLFGNVTFMEREPRVWVHWHTSDLDWPRYTHRVSRPMRLPIKGIECPFKSHYLTLLPPLTLRPEFVSFFKLRLEPKALSFQFQSSAKISPVKWLQNRSISPPRPVSLLWPLKWVSHLRQKPPFQVKMVFAINGLKRVFQTLKHLLKLNS